MARVDETRQGVHDFTVGWWRQLPQAHRLADRAQGEVLAPVWDGLNRDPRFITGFDGWVRTNTSGQNPYIASISFTRTFTVTPNVPVLVRSWHTPLIVGGVALSRVQVTHTVRNYSGAVVASVQSMVTAERGTVDTWVTPDRFGRVTVTVDVAIETPGTGGFGPEVTEVEPGVYRITGATLTETGPGVYTSADPSVVITEIEPGVYRITGTRSGEYTAGSMNVLGAIHVGTREVTFEELPDLASFLVHKPYPLLRFMDGIGHLAGYLDDELAHMWDGDTFNPVTAPDEWLRFLATMLGIPRKYLSQLSLGQIRSHLVAFIEQGRPPIGSRRAIAEIAKQWLTGNKQVTVLPANAAPKIALTADHALLTAVNGPTASGRVLVSETSPTPEVENRWTGTPNASVSFRYTDGALTGENRILNPSFRTSINHWSVARGTITRDTTRFETAGASAKITPTSTNADWYLIHDDMAVSATGWANVRFRVYTETTRRLRIKMWGYDGEPTRLGDTLSIPANTWTLVTGRFPLLQGRRYRPSLIPDSRDRSTAPIWVDRVSLARDTWGVEEFFDGDTPDSSVNDVWVKPATTPEVYEWDSTTRRVRAVGDYTTQANAVIAASQRQDRAHTLLMLVRADELPNRDLAAFQRFMMGTGTIPAGHELVCLEAQTTWDAWENTVGTTWNDLESRTRTWTDMEAAGVALDY